MSQSSKKVSFEDWLPGYEVAAAVWRWADKETDLLLRGPLLGEARQRDAGHTGEIRSSSRDYLLASVRNEDRRRVWKVWTLVLGGTIFLAFLIIAVAAFKDFRALGDKLDALRQRETELSQKSEGGLDHVSVLARPRISSGRRHFNLR